MDGIHDLGGKQGHGPVPVETGDAPFTHDWERRMWGLARAGIAHGITIDWFRHGLERMVPEDYLSYSYFQKWATNYLMLLIDTGQIDMAEVTEGRKSPPMPPASALDIDAVLQFQKELCTDFSRTIDTQPAHEVGERVLTRSHTTAPHSRLPQYAQGRTGTIISYHGAHLLPDAGARGVHEADHLYTVAFTATELWGAEANPSDSVTLELWECYFEDR